MPPDYIVQNQLTQRITKFAYRVFNFYNGKINIYNDAIMEVSWLYCIGSTRVATARNPNHITLFPMVLLRVFEPNSYWFWFNLYAAIIHELFHTDQLISYIRMRNDPDYMRLIESHVEMETYLYIGSHLNELQQFGLDDRVGAMNYYGFAAGFETGSLYQRGNYMEHMISMLKDILYLDEHPVLDEFRYIFSIPESRIDCKINEVYFNLKTEDRLFPIEKLNKIFEEQFFKYSLWRGEVCINSNMHNHYVLHISTSCRNNMCSTIPQQY